MKRGMESLYLRTVSVAEDFGTQKWCRSEHSGQDQERNLEKLYWLKSMNVLETNVRGVLQASQRCKLEKRKGGLFGELHQKTSNRTTHNHVSAHFAFAACSLFNQPHVSNIQSESQKISSTGEKCKAKGLSRFSRWCAVRQIDFAG